MGINIDLQIYNRENLWNRFVEVTKIENNKANKEKYEYILRLHGHILGDSYIILNNELYEDDNYYYSLTRHLLYGFGFIGYNEANEDFEDDWNIDKIGFDLFCDWLLKEERESTPTELNEDIYDIKHLIDNYNAESK